jgi:gamma-glutamyltranspeptidase/glutathione hydrolase
MRIAAVRHLGIVAWLWAVASAGGQEMSGGPTTGQQGMVATVHPLATEAALGAVRQGGNAVDAAVAAALTLGVVDGHNSGLGGGCLILIRRPDGAVVALDGRETAPRGASRDMYVVKGQVDPQLSKTGPLAVAVPGALAAYDRAIAAYGRLSLAELILPAADLAQAGFRLDRFYAESLQQTQRALRRFPGSRAVFFKPDGSTYAAGETLRQPDLARSYRHIGRDGASWFYRGPFARAVAEWMGSQGGLVTQRDFQDYQWRQREPVQTTYRGLQIVGFPPPSSGGIHVGQILNILEQFDLQSLRQRDPALPWHVIAEAMKLALADRAHWLGDADFAAVPRGLTDKSYAAELARRIKLSGPLAVEAHGWPTGWRSSRFGGHTTHVATADRDGHWVAITATINTTFGSKVVVPGTGIVLNNEMDDFAARPGVPNEFGLLGNAANAIAPGKRPLSSMSPTIVLRDGQPILTLGAAGGPRIITQVVLAILQLLEWKQPLPQALAHGRLHHQWFPDVLYCEASFPERIRTRLIEMGHRVAVEPAFGATQAIRYDRQIDRFVGVHDPRVPGKAAGW